MKFIIVGNMFQGTTSLEIFMRRKGVLVARSETDTRDNMADKFTERFPNCIPVIIWSNKKPRVDITNWLFLKPIIINLEQIAKRKDFPWLNKGSSNHKYLDQNKHFMAAVLNRE